MWQWSCVALRETEEEEAVAGAVEGSQGKVGRERKPGTQLRQVREQRRAPSPHWAGSGDFSLHLRTEACLVDNASDNLRVCSGDVNTAHHAS